MAGLETIHKVVERIEVEGGKAAENAFGRLAGATDKAAAALGAAAGATKKLASGFDKAEDAADAAGDAVKKAGQGAAGAGEKAAGGIGKWVSGMFSAQLAANLLSKAIEFVIGKLRDMVAQAWNVNVAVEAAGSRIQGMTLGLMDLEHLDPMQQVAVSSKIATQTLAEFRDMAMRTATPIATIEAANAHIMPVLAGLGKKQAEINKLTEMSAASAKVYGERAEMAGSIVGKAISTGVVEGETAFARAFKAQAQITSKMTVAERFERVNEVIKRMAGPIKAVTADTAGALSRWQILSEDILQRVTFPIYQKIGQVVAKIVDWAEENKEWLDKIVADITKWLETAMSVAEATWDIGRALDEVLGVTNKIGDSNRATWETLDAIADTMRLIVLLFRDVEESIEVINDPTRGAGKLFETSQRISIVWLQIQQSIMDAGAAMGRFLEPRWVREILKLTGIKAPAEYLEAVSEVLGSQIEMEEKRLAEMQGRVAAGLDAGEVAGKVREGAANALADAMSKALTKKPIKVTQNIAKVEVHQDFRDQDPDRVLIEFTQMLEGLGERAIQSTAGGAMTELEAGAAGG